MTIVSGGNERCSQGRGASANETPNKFFVTTFQLKNSTSVGYDSPGAATVGLQRKTALSVKRLQPFPRFQAE
jgi:hypothetical protein